MENKIEFIRGDGANHTFAIPASSWTAGGRLFFAAKAAVDDDTTDANALIQGNWGDSSVTDVVINGVAYKQYACSFTEDATNSIASNGALVLELLGEFQWVPESGSPVTFPAGEEKLRTILYFDVKRKTTL